MVEILLFFGCGRRSKSTFSDDDDCRLFVSHRLQTKINCL